MLRTDGVCRHHRLYFGSGGYEIYCWDCSAHWVADLAVSRIQDTLTPEQDKRLLEKFCSLNNHPDFAFRVLPGSSIPLPYNAIQQP